MCYLFCDSPGIFEKRHSLRERFSSNWGANVVVTLFCLVKQIVQYSPVKETNRLLSIQLFMFALDSRHRKRDGQMSRQMSSLLFGGRNALNSMPHYGHQHQDDLKKRINRRADAWQNGCNRKMDDHLVHTTTNHHPPKMDVLPKTFLQIILAANWPVWPSSTSPKQQRQHRNINDRIKKNIKGRRIGHTKSNSLDKL